MEYLTDEDYAIAEANGIPRHNVYRRFYDGWSKQRAITQPIGKWSKYKETCKQNGVSTSIFHSRLCRGMSPEKAATLPPMQQGMKYINPKLPQEVVKQAAENGISIYTLRQRVYVYRWSVEKAVSTPVDSSKRKKAQ